MIRTILFTAFFATSSIVVYAQNSAQRQKHYHTENKLALAGYDPVSYFSGQPTKGQKEISHNHEGIRYHFSSEANRDVFKATPAKYEPAYGGWCAYAMATNGEKVEVDMLTYKILNGRLLLFYNAYFNNTLKKWNAMKTQESELLKKADQAWQKHLTQ